MCFTESLRREPPTATPRDEPDVVYPATGDQLAPGVQKTDVDTFDDPLLGLPRSVAEIARDPSSNTRDRASDESRRHIRDRPSDASRPDNRDRPSDVSRPDNRDRPSDESRPDNRDHPSDESRPDNRDHPSDESRPDNRDHPSDESQPDNRDHPSDESQPDNRDRPSDESRPDNRDHPSDESRPDNRDRPSDESRPKPRSLLWPGFSGVALFLVLLPASCIITVIVVNVRSQPPSSPGPPRAPRNRARDHRRAVLRYTRYLGRSLELYPKRRVEETLTLWNPRTRKPEDLVMWYIEDMPVCPHHRSDQLVTRWLESMEELPVGPDPPKTASSVVFTSRHVGGCS